MNKVTRKTPLRRALRGDSALLPLVADGLGAVKAADRNYFDNAIRSNFADSLELDEAVKRGHEQESRWDYLLGHEPSGEVIAVEPHSAKQDEINAVINKRVAARKQLRDHLRENARVTKWLWVASGKVHFADTEKTKRLLDQNGIVFVGKRVTGKHLSVALAADSRPAGNPRRSGKRK
ncbi:MAG: hypothetical protein ACK5TK_12070 [Betaproteobacteria bacterium]